MKMTERKAHRVPWPALPPNFDPPYIAMLLPHHVVPEISVKSVDNLYTFHKLYAFNLILADCDFIDSSHATCVKSQWRTGPCRAGYHRSRLRRVTDGLTDWQTKLLYTHRAAVHLAIKLTLLFDFIVNNWIMTMCFVVWEVTKRFRIDLTEMTLISQMGKKPLQLLLKSEHLHIFFRNDNFEIVSTI